MARDSYNLETGEKNGGHNRQRKTSRFLWILIIAILAIITLIFIICFSIYYLRYQRILSQDNVRPPWLGPGPSASLLGRYRHFAVASDAAACASIGNYYLHHRGGSTIDAAITTLLCNGIINLHSMGIGGGFFMVYYDRASKKSYTLDSREVAPGQAKEDTFIGKPKNASTIGGLSVAVPGEIKGYYQAWKKFGKLPWKDLFVPTIHMLKNGYYVADSLAPKIKKYKFRIGKDENLKKMLLKPNGDPKEAGDIIQNMKLSKTLERISEEPDALYGGTLTDTVAREIKEAGGIITADDLRNYQPVWREPVQVSLKGGKLTVHALAPPSSGILVAFALNILEGYGFSSKTLNSLQSATTFYHRAVETLKFAFAKRSNLGDASFVNVSQLMKNLTSPDYIQQVRSRINDQRTHKVSYYGPSFEIPDDQGTTHLSLVGPTGDAVSVTSTINGVFGAVLMGDNTGIIYNNEMDDFSTPNTTNYFDVPASPTNFIKPGKRPMSSMTPIIVTNDDGDVRLVLGTSGGTRIISVTAMAAVYNLLLEENIKEAIDHVRFHHQLVPNEIQAEADFPKVILDALVAKGHTIAKKPMIMSACQGIQRLQNGTLLTNADYRKDGRTSGE